ncbi:unnamed protein product [Chrysoparadoxa australica]
MGIGEMVLSFFERLFVRPFEGGEVITPQDSGGPKGPAKRSRVQCDEGERGSEGRPLRDIRGAQEELEEERSRGEASIRRKQRELKVLERVLFEAEDTGDSAVQAKLNTFCRLFIQIEQLKEAGRQGTGVLEEQEMWGG